MLQQGLQKLGGRLNVSFLAEPESEVLTATSCASVAVLRRAEAQQRGRAIALRASIACREE